MNKYAFLAIAAALSLSAKGFCAEVSFDKGVDVNKVIQEAGRPFNGPQPGHPQPDGHNGPGNHGGGNHPGNDHGGFPGNHGGDNHPGNDHGGFPGGHDWDNHPGGWDGHPGDHGWDDYHQQPYAPVYPGMNCRTMQFTAQTPSTLTQEITAEEQSFDCYTNNGIQYCRPTGRYFSRKVTVNIGFRPLQAWEKESLEVCLDNGNVARLELGGMLYEYSVTSQNHDGFFGGHSTTFNLTPGAKKPAKPEAKELSVQAAAIGEGGALFIAVADARADYFRGEQIDIRVEGMNVPDIAGITNPADIINAFVNIKTAASFPVAPLYNIKLTDTPKPGKYVVTITFSRRGQLSSSESASTVETFEIK